MANDSQSWQAIGDADPWQEIDGLLQQVATLCKSQVSAADFYQQVLAELLRVISGTAGLVWLQDHDQLYRPVARMHLDAVFESDDPVVLNDHFQSISNQTSLQEVSILPCRQLSAANQSDLMLLLAPVKLENRTVALIEIFVPSGAAPAVQRGYEELLAAICEIASDFQRNCSLSESKDREQLWSKIDQFAREIHASLDLQQTAYAVANRGREIIACDRLSVCRFDRGKSKTLAISGVDRVEHRSNVVRAMQQLANVVCQTQDILWYQESSSNDLPPQIQLALNEYLDQSTSRTVVVVPILHRADEKGNTTENNATQDKSRNNAAAEPVAVLVVEWFHAAADAAASGRINLVADHSKRALVNSLEYQELPLLWLVRALRGSAWLVKAKQLPKSVMVALFLLVTTLALCFIPADFEIETAGQLQPEVRHDIFAPFEGKIRKFNVDSPNVTSGQTLAELINTKQDVDLTTVEGNLASARSSLEAANLAFLNLSEDKKDQQVKDEIKAKQNELSAKIKSYEAQLLLLKNQQQSFLIKSPIGGKVLTWDVVRKISGRPVQRGQVLMTVADTAGPWILELWVSDKDIGHVLAQQEEQQGPLTIEFMLASQSGKKMTGQIQQIGMSTELDENQSPAVKVTVAVNRDEIDNPRPGNTAVAKIHCGRRSIGYVWFHDLWQAAQLHLFF